MPIMLLDKQLVGSEILSYIQERANLWDVCRQLTRNELVEALADSYEEIQTIAESKNSHKELHKFLKDVIEEKHPRSNLLILSVAARKIASADVLARLDHKKFFPTDDWVGQLAFIQSSKLLETIRTRDGYATKSPEQEWREKKEAMRKKMAEEDLERLRANLEEAKRDLAGSPESLKKQRVSKVKSIEETIKRVQQTGEPLSSIRWVEQ